MYCRNCGKILNQGETFCANCGTKVEVEMDSIIDNNVIQNNQALSNVNTFNGNFNQNQESGQVLNRTTFNRQTQINNGNLICVSNQQYNNAQSNQQFNQMNIQYSNNDVNKNGKSLASLILGIVSIVLSFVLNIFVIPIAIVGLVLGLIDKNKNGKKIVGIILNSCGIILSIIVLIIGIISLGTGLGDNSIFYGDGYQLEYNTDWVNGTIQGKDALSYIEIENSYFLPIGVSTLDNTIDCDFDSTSCQTMLYNEFYNYWCKSLNAQSLYLYKDDYMFKVLKDDIYYGTYDYGKSSMALSGKYYLLVSKEKNVVLSFMTNSDVEHFKEMNIETLKLLQNIVINTSSNDDGSSSEDEKLIYDIMGSMSSWNMYSDLRSGNLGEVLSITGGWRLLGELENYWEFKNDEFWLYESVNDLNDNYYYGTTQIVAGKEGMKLAGLDESKVDDIISRANGKVKASDIYTMVLTPTKVMSGGVDTTSTNIPENTKWTYIWILVDHANEGIEAQVANLQSSGTSYYVKLED